MSLEDAIKANTAAILAHNALLEKMIGAGGAPTKPAADKAADKPASKPTADKAASKPAADKPKASSGKKKELTQEDVAKKVSEFLKTGDDDERADRKALVKKIIEHYEVDRFTNIEPADYAEALGMLAAHERGEDPFAEDGDDDGDDDGDGEDGMI